MRKMIAGAITALLLMFGFVAGATAAPREEPGPGPNGSNDHGLCTAYFNGQKNGHNKDDKPSPGPFAALEEDTEDDGSNEDRPGESSIASDVFEYCNTIGIGGNPEQNGRFDCRTNDEKDGTPRDEDPSTGPGDPAGDTEIECFVNGTEDDPTPTPAR